MKKLILLAALVFQGLAVAASETPAKDTAPVDLSLDAVLTDKVTPGSAKEVLLNLDMASFENISTAGWGFAKETTFRQYLKLYYEQDPTMYVFEEKEDETVRLTLNTRQDGFAGHGKEFSLSVLTKPYVKNTFIVCFHEYANSWYGGHYEQEIPLEVIRKENIYQVVKQYNKGIGLCAFKNSKVSVRNPEDDILYLDTALADKILAPILTEKINRGSAKDVLLNLDMTSFENISSAGLGLEEGSTFQDYLKTYVGYSHDPTMFIVEGKGEDAITLILKTELGGYPEKDGYVVVREYYFYFLHKADTDNTFLACFYEHAESLPGGHFYQTTPLKIIRKGKIYQVVKQYSKNIDGCDFYRSF